MNIKQLLEDANYMPERFRDFHDQKELFKYIHSKVKIDGHLSHISWIEAHMYTIDIFLYFMAKRGYTLQKARHKIEFIDLDQELDDFFRSKCTEIKSIFDPSGTPQDGETKALR